MAKYRLELVKRRTWGGFNKYPNCATTLCVNLSRTGNYITGLSDEDVDRLSKATGMTREALLPPAYGDATSKQGSYWKHFALRVTSKGIDIDTTDPYQEILYLFCLAHHHIANSSDKVTQHHQCVLINVDKEAIMTNEKNRKKRKVFREIDSMSTSEMRRALRVLGFHMNNVSNEVIEAKLAEAVEKDPDRFLALWVDNKDRDTIDTIESGIETNVLRKNRTVYYYGTDQIGGSITEAVAWFKNPKNKEVVAAIVNEINSKSKV